mmetsp:Transcript_2354/g.4599  ORF Transcript_2354/g.4599 Transcript_2354/m.4599 type:complete len:112 (-) Transcript_2354:281-616(-)
MVEEIDVVTRELVVRRWKVPKAFGKEGGWEYELGEPQKTANSSESLLCESSSRNVSCLSAQLAAMFLLFIYCSRALWRGIQQIFGNGVFATFRIQYKYTNYLLTKPSRRLF